MFPSSFLLLLITIIITLLFFQATHSGDAAQNNKPQKQFLISCPKTPNEYDNLNMPEYSACTVPTSTQTSSPTSSSLPGASPSNPCPLLQVTNSNFRRLAVSTYSTNKSVDTGKPFYLQKLVIRNVKVTTPMMLDLRRLLHFVDGGSTSNNNNNNNNDNDDRSIVIDNVEVNYIDEDGAAGLFAPVIYQPGCRISGLNPNDPNNSNLVNRIPLSSITEVVDH
jgi:hypothetical protein